MKRVKSICIGILMLFMFFIKNADAADTLKISLTPDKDAFICDCKPDANNPGGPLTKLYQGRYYVSNHACAARTPMHWDLSSLPKNAVITKAIVELKCTSIYGTLTGQMAFFTLTDAWDGTKITSNNVPAYSTKYSVTMDWPKAGQWFSFDVTQLAKFWYAKSDSNFGILGHSVNTTSNNGAIEYNSSRFALGSDRPKLTISYIIPTNGEYLGKTMPSEFNLDVYPNPFNPSTNIRYTLDRPGRVKVRIFDLSGKKVSEPVDVYQDRGYYQFSWNAGSHSSGIYFVVLSFDKKQITKKILLMK